MSSSSVCSAASLHQVEAAWAPGPSSLLRAKLAYVLGRTGQIFNGHYANINLLQVGPVAPPRPRVIDASAPLADLAACPGAQQRRLRRARARPAPPRFPPPARLASVPKTANFSCSTPPQVWFSDACERASKDAMQAEYTADPELVVMADPSFDAFRADRCESDAFYHLIVARAASVRRSTGAGQAGRRRAVVGSSKRPAHP